MANWKDVAISGGINAIGPGIDFYTNIKEGNGIVKSAAKAGYNFALQEAITGVLGVGPAIAINFASLAGTATDAFIQHGRQNAQTMRSKVSGSGRVGSGYVDTSTFTDTMRQRNLEQMGGHQAFARSALGSEGRRRSMMVNYY